MKKMLEKFVSLNVKQTKALDRRFPHFVHKNSYRDELLSLINDFINKRQLSHVLEIGGIDRPLLKKSPKIEYSGLDIEYKDRCEEFYDHFQVQSIEEPIFGTYDLIVSTALLEHVHNNTLSFAHMHKALKTGGCIIHYAPSKYHPYSLILRFTGPKIQKWLIKAFRPWAKQTTGYPVFFDKCSPNDIKKLSINSGFRQIKIIPFFRANDYFRFFIPAYILVTLWENICRRLKLAQFCSGFIIVASK
jgi:SAM-dependent methyltransferase